MPDSSLSFPPHVAIVATCLKLLTLHAYRSTDLDVHRHWLSLTHSLPVHRWYWDETSQWTLDYPPLFAWFRWLLAQVAVLLRPSLLQLRPDADRSPATIAFMSGCVIVSDSLLVWAVHRWLRFLTTAEAGRQAEPWRQALASHRRSLSEASSDARSRDSCDQNARVVRFHGQRVSLRCISNIAKHEQVCISYGLHYKYDRWCERRRQLKQSYCFDCECNACHERRQPIMHAFTCTRRHRRGSPAFKSNCDSQSASTTCPSSASTASLCPGPVMEAEIEEGTCDNKRREATRSRKEEGEGDEEEDRLACRS